jgi:hypothetical protein
LPSGIALTLTEMGFCPVCNRSSTPGFPTYLQTNTLRLVGVVVLPPVVDDPCVDDP